MYTLFWYRFLKNKKSLTVAKLTDCVDRMVIDIDVLS